MNSSNKLTIVESIIWALFDFIPYQIDSLVRNLDRELFRTDNEGGVTRRVFQSQGHSIILFFLFAVMIYFVIAGPTYDMFFSGSFHPFILFAIALLSLLGFGRFVWPHIYGLQLAILIATVIWIIAYADVFESEKEAAGLIYKHIYLAIAPIMMTLPLIACWGLKLLFKSLDTTDMKKKFAQCLTQVELFEDRESKTKEVKVGFTLDRLFNSVMLAIFYNPVLLFLLPSYLILLIPERHDLWLSFFIGLGCSFVLLLYGRLRVRWHMLVQLVERATTNGIPLAISLVVIVAALGRLLNFSYIAIFLDGTRLTIWGYLLAFYAFSWMFEYWINRFLNERLLSLFSSSLGSGKYQLPYRYEGKNILNNDVESKRDRILQIHGGSRFMVRSVASSENVEGISTKGKKPKQWFHSYTRGELLERLLFIAPDQQSFIANKKLLNIFLRKIRIYFFSLNTFFVIALVGFIYSQQTRSVAPLYADKPLLENADSQRIDCQEYNSNVEKFAFRLDCAIINFASNRQLANGEGGAAILFAASGGGTRAALHTASVLYGLRTHNLSEDILLMSGVSGGGVSSAYFSQHYSLLNGDSKKVDCSEQLTGNKYFDDNVFDDYPAWRCYFSAMSHPYIKDVVEGMAEWRILGDENNGRILEESLGSQFALLSSDDEQQIRFEKLKTHGLILNTTITGHRLQESDELSRLYRHASPEQMQQYYFTIFQGGRLALSNLSDTGRLQFASYAQTGDLALKYKALNMPGMALATASAMTANFPPVFSDARLCLSKNCNITTEANKSSDYFVTDGGATHNQGLISLLAATQAAVDKIPGCEKGQEKPLPRLHIIVAEGSYANFDYAEGGRGLGAALASGYGLGNGIVGQQFDQVRKQYSQKFLSCQKQVDEAIAKKPSIQVHLMALPRMFRSRGGMGTHWMMPTSIQMTLPDQIDNKHAEKFELDRDHLESYFASAYSRHLEFCSDTLMVSNQDRQQLCRALQLDGSSPVGTSANPGCTPWLRLQSQITSTEQCREDEGAAMP